MAQLVDTGALLARVAIDTMHLNLWYLWCFPAHIPFELLETLGHYVSALDPLLNEPLRSSLVLQSIKN